MVLNLYSAVTIEEGIDRTNNLLLETNLKLKFGHETNYVLYARIQVRSQVVLYSTVTIQ